MSVLFSILAFALTHACGCCGGYGGYGGIGGFGGYGSYGCGAGLGCGWGGMGCGCGYGSFGGLGYTGGMYGGWLSGSELSEEELEELCCSGYSFPSGCCYELCDDCCFSDELCDECCFSDELCGCAAPCGGYDSCDGGYQMGGCQPTFQTCQPAYRPVYQPIAIQQPVCQAPTGYARGANIAGGKICGHQNSRCAAAAGMGSRNCGYNQGNVCGAAAQARLDANACRRHGDRHFARKCADEFMVRRCNEGVATGNDCYDSARAHMCGSGARIAGNRACGNANANYCNAAGMRCANRGISGKAGCARMGAYGVASPSGCGTAMPATYSTGCGSPCMC